MMPAALSASSRLPSPLDALIGDSLAIQTLKDRIARCAPTGLPVLIEGESGCGKELVAQALHQLERPAQPWLAINCAAIPADLIESSLFGHAKGAYTGAQSCQCGWCETVGGGTLFLDEIAELPLNLQAKLLRVLETGEFRRVGETTLRHCSGRLIAASNRPLQAEIEAGRFRADLYHRLAILTLTVPPLRALGDDRWRLLDHFLRHYAAQLQLPPFELDPAARQRWNDYPFPGNTRELRNLVLRLLVHHAGTTLSAGQLDAEFGNLAPAAAVAPDHPAADLRFRLDDHLKQLERDYLAGAIRQTHGNISAAAKRLGLPRTTFSDRLAAFGLRFS